MNPKLYKKALRAAYKVTRNWQDAEDAVQTAALKLLETKVVMQYDTYFTTGAYYAGINIIRMRDYLTVRHHRAHLESPKVDYQNPRDPHATDRLVEGLNTLPKGQLAVIKHVLSDEPLSTFPGNKETVKSHYFFGVKKLRQHFKEVA